MGMPADKGWGRPLGAQTRAACSDGHAKLKGAVSTALPQVQAKAPVTKAPVTKEGAAKIQSTEARRHGGKVEKGGLASEAQVRCGAQDAGCHP